MKIVVMILLAGCASESKGRNGGAGGVGGGGMAGAGGGGGSGGNLGVISNQIQIGFAYSDVSPHQLVRTSGNVLYTAGPTCDAFPGCPNNKLKMYRANQAGRPSSFNELDATHEPVGVGSVALAIDGADKIHVVWNTRVSGGRALYTVFDPSSDTWGAPETIEQTGWTGFGQGDEGIGLALDASGAPHAVWNVQAADSSLRIHWARRSGGSWGAIMEIDDVRVKSSRHPTIAFNAEGELRVIWIDGGTEYARDGIVRVRTRATGGAWPASLTIPDQAMTAIDNGPSLLVTPDAVWHTSFCNYGNEIRYWYDAGGGWKGDQQPPATVTHNPSLGPDGAGGVYLYGHGTPRLAIQGHGDDLFYFHKAAGGSTWSAWTKFVSGTYDSSISVRWSQFFHRFPEALDIVYWNDGYPNIMFAGTN